MRNGHTQHFGAELGVVFNLLTRHDSRLEDFLVVVNVVDKPIQGRHALHQPLFHAGPFVGRNDAGNQVKRNQPLGARAVFVLFSVHRKGNSHAAKDHFCFFAPFGHHVTGLARQPGVIDFVMVANLLALSEKLVGQLGVHLVKFPHKNLSLSTL